MNSRDDRICQSPCVHRCGRHASDYAREVVLAATLMPPQTKKKRKEWAKLYLKNRDEFSHMKLIKSFDDEDFRIY